MNDNALLFEIELDALERRPGLGERDALALLHSEFRLAFNASHFVALSAEDPDVVVLSRSHPQEGVARYVLTLEFTPRRPLREHEAIALVRSELQRALNAAHFWRIFVEDPSVAIAAGEPAVSEQPALRHAA